MAITKKGPFGMILKAVIIYDDFDSAAHATALLERVAHRTDVGVKLDIKPWRCDVMKQPALAALTVAVAANADLIVLALDRIPSPTTELLNWLKNWAEHRRVKDAAVLALTTVKSRSQSTFWNEIKTFTTEHDLTLLGNHNVRNNRHSTPLAHLWPRRKPMDIPSSRPAVTERLPVPHHWGINE
ncbi:MAG TPA: hypothetical protein VKU37_11990 [Verrucomicrobiae bacterium]|nr:hypothetical protein [Verrucomicrobiae bacterium]